jgi:predicted MFS family arabinose efflux permease
VTRNIGKRLEGSECRRATCTPARLTNPSAILALLTALNLLNYIDRYILAAVLPLLQDDLRLSNTAAGALGTVFLVGYFTTSPIFGRLSDRAAVGGRRRLMALGVAVWSVATFASGLARGVWSLGAARAVVGVGEASYATVAPTLIDDMAAPEKKGRWLSIFYVAIPIGSALGYVIGGLLGKLGWRAAFYFVGGPGILAALSCLLIVEPARREGDGVAGGARAMWDSIATLARIPLFRRSVLGYAAQTFALGGFAFWAPKFLVEAYDLPVSKGATTFGAILVVAGGIGTWLGGFLSDRAAVREGVATDPTGAARIDLVVCAISGAIAAPLAVAAFWAPSAKVFFVLAFVCEVAAFASTAPVSAALLRTVPVELRASGMAAAIFAIHFFGDLWSPLLLGAARDVFPIRAAMMGVPFALAVSAGLWVPPAIKRP